MTDPAAPTPPLVQHAHVELDTASTIQLTGTQVEIFHPLHEKIIWDFHQLGEVNDLQGFGNWAIEFRNYCRTLNLTARITQIDNTFVPTNPPNAIDLHHGFALAKNVIDLLNTLASLPPSPAPATAVPTQAAGAAGASGSHTPPVPPEFRNFRRQLAMLEDLMADLESTAPAPPPPPVAESATAAPPPQPQAPHRPADFQVPTPAAEMEAERVARRARIASTPPSAIQSQQGDRDLLRQVLVAGRSVPSDSNATPVPRPADLASLSGPTSPVVHGFNTYQRIIGPAEQQTNLRMANALIARLNSRTDQHQVDRYGHLQTVAFFCHGWQRGMQLGLKPGTAGNLQVFAAAVAAVADPDAKFRVILYCCSTGASPTARVGPNDGAEHDHNNDQHGAGSLAEALCDALRTAGLTDVQVDAHRNVGSAAENPLVRRFATTDFGYPPPSDSPSAPADPHAPIPPPIQPIEGIYRIDLAQYPTTLTEIPGTPELPASPGEILLAMSRTISHVWVDPPTPVSAVPIDTRGLRGPPLWAAYPFHDVATIRRYLAPTVMTIRQARARRDAARAAATNRSAANSGAHR